LGTIDFERVTATGLVKVYGATRALAGVAVGFEAGRCTAVLGPNGSGKSTLLAILSTLTRPTRGEVRYGRHAPGPAVRARIGMLAHAPMLYPDLSGLENLRLFAALHGVGAAERCIARLCERFEMGGFVERPVRTYSRGQLQRVALARALVHTPRLLLLDEPSTGLDRASVERLVRAVDEEKMRGAIVVLVTHDESLAARLADERLTLERGRVTGGAA
jgi:heme exporter protein A